MIDLGYTPKQQKQLISTVIAIVLIAVFIWGLSFIWEVVRPFLLAGIFAYICMPLVNLFQYKLKMKYRGLAVFSVFILITSIIILSSLYLIPSIQQEISKTLQTLSNYNGTKNVLELLIPDKLLILIKEKFDISDLSKVMSMDHILDGIKSLQGQVSSIINGTIFFVSWGMAFMMSVLYFIFFLVDFEGLTKGFLSFFPETSHKRLSSIGREMDCYMNSYFRGQAVIALSVMVLLIIGFNIIGLPMATAMAVLIGVLNFVPYMQILGVLPLTFAAILMSVQSGENVAFCIFLAYGVLAITQFIQDGLIVPRVMANRMGIRPSLVLVTLSIWAYLLGFFGLIIALPATMILYSLYKRYILQDEVYIQKIDKKFSA